MLGVVHLLMLQVALGISTLIYLVPTPLASAHQAGSFGDFVYPGIGTGSSSMDPEANLEVGTAESGATAAVPVGKAGSDLGRNSQVRERSRLKHPFGKQVGHGKAEDRV